MRSELHTSMLKETGISIRKQIYCSSAQWNEMKAVFDKSAVQVGSNLEFKIAAELNKILGAPLLRESVEEPLKGLPHEASPRNILSRFE